MSAPVASPGRLFVVATPIGNLRDLSERAAEVLREAAVVAAEDTRHSEKLLRRVGSRARCLSFHEHNETPRAEALLQTLRDGGDVALVSDAGTPLISDPGYALIRAAQAAGLRVIPVPGASAVTAALSVAGLPTDRFCFEGFLPQRDKARRERLQALALEPRTVVFFEAPHRVVAALRALLEAFGGEREITVAREMTKQFESVARMPLGEVVNWIESDPDRQRGEFVLVVAGAPARAAASGDEGRALLSALLEELPLARAARLAARITGQPRQALYQLGLSLGEPASRD